MDGFLYAATGERWVREAIASATRLREVHPQVPIVLFTDLPELGGPFDEVRVVPERTWVRSEVKVWSVARTPFERTVYLDTDTYACSDLSELFMALDRFDFAAVPVALRLSKRVGHADPTDIPDAFQTVNGGMFSWRSNDKTRALFEAWWELYQADRATSGDDKVADQPSLRVALWRTDCHILLLPPEFNMRTNRYRGRPTVAVGPVRLIHGRPRDFPALARHWNSSMTPRILSPVEKNGARQLLRFVRGARPHRRG